MDNQPTDSPDQPEQFIYSFGYEGRELSELIEYAKTLHAIVIDTRFNPASRVKGWNRKELGFVLPEYIWVKDFGNINYQHPDLGIQLHDPEAGIERVTPFLQYGRNIILLCYEANVQTCHRRDVAELLSSRFGLRVVHLLPHGSQLSLF